MVKYTFAYFLTLIFRCRVNFWQIYGKHFPIAVPNGIYICFQLHLQIITYLMRGTDTKLGCYKRSI